MLVKMAPPADGLQVVLVERGAAVSQPDQVVHLVGEPVAPLAPPAEPAKNL